MRENFTDSEINHICEINRRLINLRDWCKARTELALGYCNTNSGTSEIGFDDYEMEVTFKFSLGESDKRFNTFNEYDNRITVFSMPGESMLASDMEALNWNEGIPEIRKFKDTHFCYLFHHLFEHKLHCDWNALLRIGEIWVEHDLIIQRMMHWDDIPLPEGFSKNEKQSVFSSAWTTDSYRSYRPHTSDEFLHIQLLNKKVKDAERWNYAQARRMEYAYLDGWKHKNFGESSRIHEDYALCLKSGCILSERHSEYMTNEDNILTSVQELLPRNDEFIFGSPRNPMQSEGFWHLHEDFDDYRHYCSENGMSPPNYEDWRFCGLFNRIHDGLDNDWHRTLCIGGLWLDVLLKQRCIVQLSEMEKHQC